MTIFYHLLLAKLVEVGCRHKKRALVALSVRKVPQLYSPKASYIASQLYDASHRDIVLQTVKRRI